MLRTVCSLLSGVSLLVWTSLGLASAGHLKVLTYNIAGLPDGFMTAHPSANMPLIGPLLAPYDLVLIQEDFAYGVELRRNVAQPFQSPPFLRTGQWNFGDGLSLFSSRPFSRLFREPWRACHGVVDSYFDCLTPKGYSVARQTLGPELELDVYDIHLDAGASPGDEQARAAQIDQLIEAIVQRSRGRAVLVGGDTNVRSREYALLERFEQATGLSDACSALHCPERARIDRIFYRSSATLTLRPRSFRLDARFVNVRREPLSDHLPVAVEFDWSSAGERGRP